MTVINVDKFSASFVISNGSRWKCCNDLPPLCLPHWLHLWRIFKVTVSGHCWQWLRTEGPTFDFSKGTDSFLLHSFDTGSETRTKSIVNCKPATVAVRPNYQTYIARLRLLNNLFAVLKAEGEKSKRVSIKYVRRCTLKQAVGDEMRRGFRNFKYLWDSSPSTRHGGAWGERRYSSYLFTTSALDGGEWSFMR
jgi:hypothetical protein